MSGKLHRTPQAETTSTTVSSPNPSLQPQPDFQANFDTPNHVRIGDDVGGDAVEVHGVVFTPGEIAALVDFVGCADALWGYGHADLVAMQQQLHKPARECEDTAFWDEITHGGYSRDAQQNEDHFAPDADGGRDFATSFVTGFARAYELEQQAVDAEGDEAATLHARALVSAYGAEHYLQDAFSAGHQVSADAIGEAVDAVMGGYLESDDLVRVGATAAPLVFAKHADVIGRWEWESPTGWSAIDTQAEWFSLVEGGAWYGGADGVKDAIRKAIHEELAASEGDVVVTLPEHPAPFVLGGDKAPTPESEEVLKAALAIVRMTLAHAIPGRDATEVAMALFERLRPVPTFETQALVDGMVARATADHAAIGTAVAHGLGETLPDVMAGIAKASGGLVRERVAVEPGNALPETFPWPDHARGEWPELDRHADRTRPNPWSQAA